MGLGRKGKLAIFAKLPSVVIVGAGAVGSGVAAFLQEGGFSRFVFYKEGTFFQRAHHLRLASGAQLELTSTLDPQAFTWKDATLVVLCCPAFSLASILREISSALPLGCVVLSACNGMVLDELNVFQEERKDLIARTGFVDFGSRRVSESEFVLSNAKGKVKWGPLQQNLRPTLVESELCKIWRFAFYPDIVPLVWEKWFFNTVANSVGAYHRLAKNGDLLLHRDMVEGLAHEVYSELNTRFPKQFDFKELLSRFWLLIADTAENENSMAAALRLGKPLEHKYLLGKLTQPGPIANQISQVLS